jgi:hypothetical protein
VVQKMYELTELQKQGMFKAKTDKDVLSTAIGSKSMEAASEACPLS